MSSHAALPAEIPPPVSDAVDGLRDSLRAWPGCEGITLEVEATTEAGWPAFGRAAAAAPTAAWQNDGNQFVLAVPGIASTLANLTSSSVRLFILPGTTAEPHAIRHVALSGVMPLLHRRGLVSLHTFGAARDSSHGVLLVGPTGSGKTTAGLALVRQGWQYVANDHASVGKYPP